MLYLPHLRSAHRSEERPCATPIGGPSELGRGR
jgi:hypothetical protein